MEGASAGEDKPAPAADDLVQAALDARFSIEQLEEDKTALQARVAEAEAALAACRAKTIEECIKYVESCDSGDSAASIASGLRALAKEAKT
jgi:arginine/ornithine N-succinyltransferase beta subunit